MSTEKPCYELPKADVALLNAALSKLDSDMRHNVLTLVEQSCRVAYLEGVGEGINRMSDAWARANGHTTTEEKS